MKITLEIKDSLVETVVQNLMENFPEASQGSVLSCIGWNYKDWLFGFVDDDKHYSLDKAKLIATFPRIFTDKWPKGCTPAPSSNLNDPDTWNDWLCQCDATDFDAFIQLAIFNEVIYG